MLACTIHQRTKLLQGQHFRKNSWRNVFMLMLIHLPFLRTGQYSANVQDIKEVIGIVLHCFLENQQMKDCVPPTHVCVPTIAGEL